MKIIIAGAGEVGTHLARMLEHENHDITLIDDKESRLAPIASHLDIKTICGSPTSPSVLEEAEVEKAHLFIGVTPEQSRNMTSCMIAKDKGAKNTVARIEELEYTIEDNRNFFKKLGIDDLVYPEQLAAAEINHLIQRPWVRHWWEVQDGKLLLLGIKVRRGCRHLGMPLSAISQPEDPYHITAIKRNGDTLIPHGGDILEEDDLVFIMTTPESVQFVRDNFSQDHSAETHTIFYMGGADTAIQSINQLPHNYHIKLFENDPSHHLEITSKITHPHVLLLDGDGRDIDLLKDENIENAQVFVAATNKSESNILACLTARRLGVPKTIAMVENSDYIPMAEQLDIGSIINKKTFAAGRIYCKLLRADVKSVKFLTIAHADVAEFQVQEGYRISRYPVSKLHLPRNVNIGGYIRNGKGYLANGNTQFQPGDIVVVFTLQGELKRLETFFK